MQLKDHTDSTKKLESPLSTATSGGFSAPTASDFSRPPPPASSSDPPSFLTNSFPAAAGPTASSADIESFLDKEDASDNCAHKNPTEIKNHRNPNDKKTKKQIEQNPRQEKNPTFGRFPTGKEDDGEESERWRFEEEPRLVSTIFPI